MEEKMFIQISKDRFMRKKDIVGIFDLDTSTVSAVTKNFLSNAEKKGETVGIGSLPKSFVAAGEKGRGAIYFSSKMAANIGKTAFIHRSR